MQGWIIPTAIGGEFVAHMENVLDIYKKPYDEEYPVVCMDESPKQLKEDRNSTAMALGQEACVDYEYVRHRSSTYSWPMSH